MRGDERAGVRATHTSDPFDLRKRYMYATPPPTLANTGHERDKAPLPVL